jgi:hypothetical protein
MRDRFVILRAAAVVLAVLLAVDCWGDPPSISSLATNTRLTAEEQESVQTYVTFWCEQLTAGKDSPDSVRTARRRLLEPLRGDLATAAFLDEYGRRLIPLLESVIDDGNAHVSANALIIVSQLGTERALDALLKRSNVRDEPKGQVRLRAARGCKDLLENQNLDSVSARMITLAARRLRDAARAEDDTLILRHQLQAILAADLARLGDKQREQIRGYLVEALQGTAQRAIEAPAEANPSGMGLFEATYPVLVETRNAYLRLDLTSQQTFGQQMGPCLGRLLAVPGAQWEAAQNAPRCKEQCGKVVHLCERFLTTLDAFVRGNDGPPETDLKGAWDAGNADRYRQDLGRWESVLGRSPYQTS